MTEKLYYKDAYIREFDAQIVEVSSVGNTYRIRLDKTAFFPEEGGQSADGGRIGTARVLDVREEGGEVYHITDTVPEGESVHCVLDFERRFEKMQCHTAEHILCGIINKLHGFSNVGFHLGDDVVTFDVDGELTPEMIEEIEALANRAVFENRPVTSYFPTHAELLSLEYRAKLEMTENVRIVDVEGIDVCACCAPHVSHTGEVGIIKIIDYMRHRGGMRFFMVAGHRALADYTARHSITRAVGAMTSTPSLDTEAAVRRLIEEKDALALEISRMAVAHARELAERIERTDGNAVCFLRDATSDAMREFANTALSSVGGILVVLTGEEGSYRYVIASNKENLRLIAKDVNTALSGKGGGRPEMISGTFAASLEDIKAYFA